MATKPSAANGQFEGTRRIPSFEAHRRTAVRPWLIAAVIVALAAYVAADAVNAYAVIQGQLTCLPGILHLV